MSTTRADLDLKLAIVQRHMPNARLDGSYGRVRLVEIVDHSTLAIRNVSPNLPKAVLAEWLDGFIAGAGYVKCGA